MASRREEVKERIDIMQAWLDGASVEVFRMGRWGPAITPTFTFNEHAYRIKPEPREIWVNEYDNGERFSYENKKSAEAMARDDGNIAVHYREVIEDEG